MIKNAFWGSDDPISANKERDIFLFPIPERPPEFQYIKTKVSLKNILKFMFPPNLEHSNSTGRLDLFALYGPTVNYYSVDSNFCNKCIKIAKEQLEETKREKEALERKKLGDKTGGAGTLSGGGTMTGSLGGTLGGSMKGKT